MLEAPQAAQALQEWCDKRGVEAGVNEFLQLLADKDALYLLPSIRKELNRSAKEDADQQAVYARAGKSVSEDHRQALLEAFGAPEGSLDEDIDPQQIAGANVTYQSRQIRGSVDAQLSQLQRHLTS
jgi:F0F1-type ATP synthase delta subunit